MNTLQIKKLNPAAKLPNKGTPSSAGYDLYSIETYTLKPFERKLFKTGLSFGIPHGLYGRIAPRSGLAFKNGIDVMAGVIDEDYRGELGIVLINLGDTPKELVAGTEIAQIIFEYYNVVELKEVNELTDTVRGTGGFGSTTDNKIEPPKSTHNLVEMWKENVGGNAAGVAKYEAMVKEREKQLG